jgi:hypothetical protein
VTLYVAKPRGISNAKRNGPEPRPRGENVVDLMDALKKSLASGGHPAWKKAPEGLRGPKGDASADRGEARRRKKKAASGQQSARPDSPSERSVVLSKGPLASFNLTPRRP